MKATAMIAGAVMLAGSLTTPAVAADKVPVTLKVKNCDGCSVTATWSKTGRIDGNFRSKTKKAKGTTATVTFQIPQGYYMYFAATSPRARVDAATVMVTQFVGKSEGDKVTASQVSTLNNGAAYCLKAKKRTIKVQAALLPYKGDTLLGLWASPQLAATGKKLKAGITGVYGTQNTLICRGKYY